MLGRAAQSTGDEVATSVACAGGSCEQADAGDAEGQAGAAQLGRRGKGECAKAVGWKNELHDRGDEEEVEQDAGRELTSLDHFIECYRQNWTLDTHPTDGVPGGRMGHYHTFTPDSLTDVVDWMRANQLCDWQLVAREDVDSKVGNGFTLVFRVRHRPDS